MERIGRDAQQDAVRHDRIGGRASELAWCAGSSWVAFAPIGLVRGKVFLGLIACDLFVASGEEGWGRIGEGRGGQGFLVIWLFRRGGRRGKMVVELVLVEGRGRCGEGRGVARRLKGSEGWSRCIDCVRCGAGLFRLTGIEDGVEVAIAWPIAWTVPVLH